MAKIIKTISEKGQLHRIHYIRNQDFVYEVMIREKGGFGMGDSIVTMECQLWPEADICECTCNKPKLLHYPCSHVYAARAKAKITPTFVSPYYLKEKVIATWSGELRDWRAIADFTKPPTGAPNYVPDPTKLVQNPGRRQCRRIRNDMDASDVRDGQKSCLACGGDHYRKDCDAYPTHKKSDGTQEKRIPKHNPKKNKDVGPSQQ